MYTLRVQEKPVGAVLRELATRLHWAIQIDEDAIRAAGKSLEKRVSFSVENVDQDKLLDALLTPAGLDYRIVEEQVRSLSAAVRRSMSDRGCSFLRRDDPFELLADFRLDLAFEHHCGEWNIAGQVQFVFGHGDSAVERYADTF